jgi:two-component system cell cycle sensor histidine kinase/response regulator CckA
LTENMGTALTRMDASIDELLHEIARLRRRLEQAAPALASSVLAALTAPQPGGPGSQGSAAMLPLVPEGMVEVLEAVAALVGADGARAVLLASPAAVWLPAGTAGPAIPEAAWERLRRGEIVLLSDTGAPSPGLEGLESGGAAALALLPLGPGDGGEPLLGALILSWARPGAVSEADGALLSAAGEIVARTVVHGRTAQMRRRRLRYLEDTMRVYAAMEGHQDLAAVLAAAVSAVREVLGCDRVFVAHPCRPNAGSLRLAAVSAADAEDGAGGALASGQEITVDEELAGALSMVLGAPGSVAFGPGNGRPLIGLARERGVAAELWVVLRVRMGEPWLLAMHQCSGPRVWTDEEQRLCTEIARRVADEIGTFLSFQSSRSNEERFRSLLAAIPDLMFVFDADGYIHEVFPLEHELLLHAPEQVLGRNVFDVLPPAVAQAAQSGVDRALATGEVQQVEYVLDLPFGRRWFSASMAQFGGSDKPRVICVSRDTTARRTLEEQLLQAQKMESVGRLAGGVSHDFNNLLTAVMSHAELAMEDLDQGSSVRQDLALIYDAASRGAALTRQLLTFARKQVISPQIVNLNDLLLRVDALLRRLLGAHIELVSMPASNLGAVRVDPLQFEQVLVNLAINARDAMPGGGKLTLETANRVLDADDVAAHPGLAPGPYVVLRVADTGIGMSEETMAHIFEPFFTTKEVGKGTGLGLATCYGVVKQGGGDIWVQSAPGQGAVFEVVLPRVEGPVHVFDDEAPALPRSGTERVLVVEDEPTVRAGAVRTLQRYGYEVIEAANGDEALALGQEALMRIDLLLTDVVMPRMSGRQLAEQVRKVKPGVPVLFVSGYTDDAIIRAPSRAQGVGFLQKPFTPVILARAVRELLDAPAAEPRAGTDGGSGATAGAGAPPAAGED